MAELLGTQKSHTLPIEDYARVLDDAVKLGFKPRAIKTEIQLFIGGRHALD